MTSNDSTNEAARYVVLGSRGKTGGRVAQRLRALGYDVVEASRSTPQRFDWDDPATWEPTLAGATGLYATYFPDLAAPGAHETVGRLAAVARAAGIERAALLSGRGEPAARLGELAFLAALPGSDVLRCAWFDQNFTEGLFAPSVAEGGLRDARSGARGRALRGRRRHRRLRDPGPDRRPSGRGARADRSGGDLHERGGEHAFGRDRWTGALRAGNRGPVRRHAQRARHPGR